MADTRILHKKGSHGERIVALNHLEFRVWVQYVLSADDFGVMRASVSVLRADNPCLEREPIKAIERALGRVIELGLIQRFKHQGEPYLWQRDWQDFQGVRYPRETVLPMPPQSDIAKATAKTQKLFGIRADRERGDFCDVCETVRSDSGVIPETSPIPAGAGARETLTLTPTPSPGSGSSEESARETKAPEPAWRRPGDPESGLTPSQFSTGNIHRMHAWCCDRGLCVPLGMHTEFCGRLGTPDADARLRAWYPEVVARYEGRSIGDNLFEFWRNEFAAWVGTVTTRTRTVASRTGDSMDAAKESLRRRLEKLQGDDADEDRALEGRGGSPDTQRPRAIVQRS